MNTTTDEELERWVCHSCVGERYLADEIVGRNEIARCDFCNETRKGLTLDALADRIHGVMQEQFGPTPLYPVEGHELWDAEKGEWERRGEPPEIIIAEIAGLSESVADAVAGLLSDWHKYEAVKGGEEDPCGSEARYEQREPRDGQFYVSWAGSRREILTQRRFFPKVAVAGLEDIFGNLNELRTVSGEPVVREIAPGDPRGVFWRARRARTDDEVETILKNPDRELGPPPPELARGLRMNAPGIPVFYGARCASICLAGIRPPVGSKIVVGKFELLRPIRILDMKALTEVLVERSHFDPNYVVSRGRAAFLKQLVIEISRPVMPEDEELEYIPTQFVAEFLANRSETELGGIFYPSTQTGGEGENVVIFNHDCGVGPYQIPDISEIEVYPPYIHPEDDDEVLGLHYTVYEYVPDEHVEEPDSPTDAGAEEGESPQTEEEKLTYGSAPESQSGEDTPITDVPPALRLDVDSMKVIQIKDARLNTHEFDVTRHRLRKPDFKTNFPALSGDDLDKLLGDADSSF